jgi:hypothetical protein
MESLAMSFPWHDPQFYVVTAAALWGGWVLLRQLLPRPKDGPACGGCAAGAAACAKRTAPGGADADAVPGAIPDADRPRLVVLNNPR